MSFTIQLPESTESSITSLGEPDLMAEEEEEMRVEELEGCQMEKEVGGMFLIINELND